MVLFLLLPAVLVVALINSYFLVLLSWSLSLLFLLLANWNFRPDLFDHIVDLGLGKVQILIDLHLVRLVELGYREHAHHNEDDEGHAIEPCSKVRQYPQNQTKLERVNEILDQEESAQFLDGVGASLHDSISHLM